MFPFRFLFKSGNPEHPGDKFYNTIVEILPEDHVGKEAGVLDNNAHNDPFPHTQDGFLAVGNFSHVTGAAEGSVPPSVGLVNMLRLRVLSQSESWVILSEVGLIFFFFVVRFHINV